jgi:hypothetical protein
MPNYLRMGQRDKAVDAARINWTDHERESVAAEALRIHQENPTLTPYKAAVRAQANVLPKARQRPLEHTQPSKVEQWLMPLWDGIRKASRQADARDGAESLFRPLADNRTEGVNIDGPQPLANAPSADDAPASADAEISTAQHKPDEPEAFIGPIIQNASENSEASSEPVKTSPASLQPPPVRHVVHWKDHEKRAVAERAFAALQRWPDMSKLEAFRKAQDFELTEDRRRALHAWENVKEWADPMLEALALEEKIEAARIAEEREAARAEAQRQAEIDAAVARQSEAAEQSEKLAFDRAVAERMNNLTFDDLIHALARRFGRAIAEGFNEGFRSMATPPIDPPPSARYVPPPASTHSPPAHHDPAQRAEPTRERLPKVCVVGLINQQAEDVKRAFLGVIEFEFVKSQKIGGSHGHGGVGMLDRCGTCECVFAMVDFLGHDVENSAKKLHVPYVRVNGSASALKRELRAWLDQRDSEARKAA